MPWFRKLADMRRVLPINALYFARSGIEVILVMDEPSEEQAVLELLNFYPDIRWQVVVNDQPHDWRPPCCAINVGLRHAQGDYVLVMSPESACVTDVPAAALRTLLEYPQAIALGQVGFACFEELESHLYTNPHLYRDHAAYLQQAQELARQFDCAVPDIFRIASFYGSICAPKAAFEAVHGYDENFTVWGGDDDNLRVRMELAGYQNLFCPHMRLLHLEDRLRRGGEQYDADDIFRKCAISTAQANDASWGQDFARVALCSGPIKNTTGIDWESSIRKTVPFIEPAKAGSRRRCSVCGNHQHYAKAFSCRHCEAGILGSAPTAQWKPRIACLMQLHDEERDLPGCLDHLAGYVDGIIALDDGSTDATAAILAAHPAVVECLHNPASSTREWNEPENRRRLLQKAQDLGYDWVLTCDADQRFERLFLEQIHELAGCFEPGKQAVLSLSMRELWDDPLQYRVDGLWGSKQTGCFFSVPKGSIHLPGTKAFHGDWFTDVLHEGGKIHRARFHLYHLKMVDKASRLERRDFYQRLDPANRLQQAGYDYLTDEGPELQLERIAPERAYDIDTLSERYRALIND
ncbi:glycosyltransferase [Halopseudomonas salegens]|nr:glycosyltransferase [Halopseudomonas salegens]